MILTPPLPGDSSASPADQAVNQIVAAGRTCCFPGSLDRIVLHSGSLGGVRLSPPGVWHTCCSIAVATARLLPHMLSLTYGPLAVLCFLFGTILTACHLRHWTDAGSGKGTGEGSGEMDMSLWKRQTVTTRVGEDGGGGSGYDDKRTRLKSLTIAVQVFGSCLSTLR